MRSKLAAISLVVILLSLGAIAATSLLKKPTEPRTPASEDTFPTLTLPQQTPPFQHAPGEIIVQLKSKPRSTARTPEEFLPSLPQAINNVHRQTPVKEIQKSTLDRFYTLRFDPEIDLEQTINQLQSDPEIESASPNYIGVIFSTPNDPNFSAQWGLTKIQAPASWDITPGNNNSVVAVVDTGVDSNHEDLLNKTVSGYDFVHVNDWSPYYGCYINSQEDYQTRDSQPTDFHGHGTHVAGIAAANTNNSKGVAGTCPDCKIMPVRVAFAIQCDSVVYGVFETDDLADGIIYAANNDADIISMSLGTQHSSLLQSAINYALNKGKVLVAAAGNSNTSSTTYSYPAAYPNVLAVGATTNTDSRASFSNYGSWVDLAAPGQNILSTTPQNTYSFASGTSMSAPFVSGLAGLILALKPEFSAAQISQALISGTDPLSASLQLGSGRINSLKTLSALSPSPSPSPQPLIGDLNSDGIVDTTDASLLIANFLQTGSHPADLNSDNFVDLTDYSILVANF